MPTARSSLKATCMAWQLNGWHGRGMRRQDACTTTRLPPCKKKQGYVSLLRTQLAATHLFLGASHVLVLGLNSGDELAADECGEGPQTPQEGWQQRAQRGLQVRHGMCVAWTHIYLKASCGTRVHEDRLMIPSM